MQQSNTEQVDNLFKDFVLSKFCAKMQNLKLLNFVTNNKAFRKTKIAVNKRMFLNGIESVVGCW